MLVSLLIFLSSTLWGNVGLLVLASILQLRHTSIKTYNTNLFKIIIAISFLSLINYLISLIINGGRFENNANTPYPYAFSMILSYIIASSLSYNNLKWLLYFLTIDCIIGIVEYTYGVSSFWTVTASNFEESSELLYFKRSNGLNNNSSMLGANACLGLCLIYIIRPQFKSVFIILMMAGLFCSFNRSYILASIPILLYFGYLCYRKSNLFIKYLLIVCGISFCLTILITLMPFIEEQFFRGGDLRGGVLSHRDEIWLEFMNFFYTHPIVGNGSVKMLLRNGWHAHNSYIWVLASNGLLIAMLYYYYLFAFITKNNLIPILTIILGSITQSTIFGGLSTFDVIVFYLILHRYQIPIYKNQQILQKIKDGQINSSKILPNKIFDRKNI